MHHRRGATSTGGNGNESYYPRATYSYRLLAWRRKGSGGGKSAGGHSKKKQGFQEVFKNAQGSGAIYLGEKKQVYGWTRSPSPKKISISEREREKTGKLISGKSSIGRFHSNHSGGAKLMSHDYLNQANLTRKPGGEKKRGKTM